MPTKRTFFLCTGQIVPLELLVRYPDSHIIGEPRHVKIEGVQMTAMAMYESPISTTDVYLISSKNKSMMRIRSWEIFALGIRCKICGKSQRWVVDKAHLKRLAACQSY
jgi:hypothetical protein